MNQSESIILIDKNLIEVVLNNTYKYQQNIVNHPNDFQNNEKLLNLHNHHHHHHHLFFKTKD